MDEPKMPRRLQPATDFPASAGTRLKRNGFCCRCAATRRRNG